MTAWPTRASEQARLEAALATYAAASRPLPGVATAACRQTLAKQMVASLRRSVGVGMEVMEDSLCNWQKSPRAFVHFRG